MSGRYGKLIPFFVPFAKFEYYLASKAVFIKGGDQPIGYAYNLQQARLVAKEWLALQEEKELRHYEYGE